MAPHVETDFTTIHEIPERPATPPPRDRALEILKLCTVPDIFRTVGYYINPEMVARVNGVVIFNIEGEPAPWFVDLKNGSGCFGQGVCPHPPDLELFMTSEVFLQLFKGEINPKLAFIFGYFRLSGSIFCAIRLESLMWAVREYYGLI
ncbi:hydroxysteroid dehydrogenase-like protein 2 [Galendromus occidentalis]|uniref:Hydroxysteroid dehydrogenase-like protein 2 n=1 Tax=Galendromus occidentalis TaxID=34638 RepID=A0AAJ6VYP7_9ACAR|nr:hydroxysteroid dehydrogenase-like protein 2 [Galendromus occidentalis]